MVDMPDRIDLPEEITTPKGIFAIIIWLFVIWYIVSPNDIAPASVLDDIGVVLAAISITGAGALTGD